MKKTLAVIKNELFKDYLRIISTEDLAKELDNPVVPIPFTSLASIDNKNADKLALELNNYFSAKKIKNKDFLELSEKDIDNLNFLFKLISISGDSVDSFVKADIAIDKKEVVAEVKVEIKEVKQEVKSNEESVKVETKVIEDVKFEAEVEVEESDSREDIIPELKIPVNTVISLVKNDSIKAKILDEKTVVYNGEKMAIIDATKKAFKDINVVGMASGLVNWSYNGQTLKALKENNV